MGPDFYPVPFDLGFFVLDCPLYPAGAAPPLGLDAQASQYGP